LIVDLTRSVMTTMKNGTDGVCGLLVKSSFGCRFWRLPRV
jgi:hypothetical protein